MHLGPHGRKVGLGEGPASGIAAGEARESGNTAAKPGPTCKGQQFLLEAGHVQAGAGGGCSHTGKPMGEHKLVQI